MQYAIYDCSQLSVSRMQIVVLARRRQHNCHRLAVKQSPPDIKKPPLNFGRAPKLDEARLRDLGNCYSSANPDGAVAKLPKATSYGTWSNGFVRELVS